MLPSSSTQLPQSSRQAPGTVCKAFLLSQLGSLALTNSLCKPHTMIKCPSSVPLGPFAPAALALWYGLTPSFLHSFLRCRSRGTFSGNPHPPFFSMCWNFYLFTSRLRDTYKMLGRFTRVCLPRLTCQYWKGRDWISFILAFPVFCLVAFWLRLATCCKYVASLFLLYLGSIFHWNNLDVTSLMGWC